MLAVDGRWRKSIGRRLFVFAFLFIAKHRNNFCLSICIWMIHSCISGNTQRDAHCFAYCIWCFVKLVYSIRWQLKLKTNKRYSLTLQRLNNVMNTWDFMSWGRNSATMSSPSGLFAHMARIQTAPVLAKNKATGKNPCIWKTRKSSQKPLELQQGYFINSWNKMESVISVAARFTLATNATSRARLRKQTKSAIKHFLKKFKQIN